MPVSCLLWEQDSPRAGGEVALGPSPHEVCNHGSMGKTDNTMPFDLQHQDGRLWFHEGGRYKGMCMIPRWANRRDRRRAKAFIRADRGELVDQHRHGAKWDMY